MKNKVWVGWCEQEAALPAPTAALPPLPELLPPALGLPGFLTILGFSNCPDFRGGNSPA